MKIGTIKTSIGVRLRPGSTDGRMIDLYGDKPRRMTAEGFFNALYDRIDKQHEKKE